MSISFWEKESFTSYDVIIIGGGIIGLSLAISLLEADIKLSVLLLERGVLPSGASTKNAGFACFGSATEIINDINTIGLDNTIAIVEKRIKGLELLRSRLGESNIDYEQNGGYELLFNSYTISKDELNDLNEKLFGLYNHNIFSIRNDLVYKFGFDQVHSIIQNKYEGQINTGKMMKSLYMKAYSLGVNILTGSEVIEINDTGKFVEVIVCNHSINENVKFISSKVSVCNNAFANKLFPTLNLKPARGQVMITSEISNLKFKGTFHFEKGFYYFRNVGNRVLIGGGRNIDLTSEESFDFVENLQILSTLKKYLTDIIIPNNNFDIEMNWQGIMGFSENKLPFVKNISSNVFCAFGCNGMGVALGSQIAIEMTMLMNQIN